METGKRSDDAKLILAVAACAAPGLAAALLMGGGVPAHPAIAAGIAALALGLSAFAAVIALRVLKRAKMRSFDDGMHLVMDSVPTVCSLYDPDNNIKYCNDAAPKLFGFKDQEDYSRHYADSFPEFQPNGRRSTDLALEVIEQIMKNGSASLDWHQKTASGELIPLQLTHVRTSYMGEQHVLEFATDMRAEIEIRRHESQLKEKMQAMLDSAPMLCAVYDERGEILEVNKEAQTLFDIPDWNIFVEEYGDFLPPFQPDGSSSAQKSEAMLRQALENGCCRFERMYRRKDGTPIPTEETLSRITVGGTNLVIAYSRDLREFYALREAEQQAQERVNEMMTRLNAQLESQASAIEESSAAIEEMIANTKSVSDILSKNARSVKILMEASDMGHSGLSEVAADIRKIAEESESLLEINAVMQNIATQTNLLSMNAAIEAAHAGSSGMGFAVVADEIRKLAESSSGQSKTIGLVLKQIKGSIDKITRSTDNVMTRFDAIDGGVRTVAEQEEGILNAMTEQGAGSAQIMQAIAQVNDITHQIKEDAHRIVEAAAKLVA